MVCASQLRYALQLSCKNPNFAAGCEQMASFPPRGAPHKADLRAYVSRYSSCLTVFSSASNCRGSTGLRTKRRWSRFTGCCGRAAAWRCFGTGRTTAFPGQQSCCRCLSRSAEGSPSTGRGIGCACGRATTRKSILTRLTRTLAPGAGSSGGAPWDV